MSTKIDMDIVTPLKRTLASYPQFKYARCRQQGHEDRIFQFLMGVSWLIQVILNNDHKTAVAVTAVKYEKASTSKGIYIIQTSARNSFAESFLFKLHNICTYNHLICTLQ